MKSFQSEIILSIGHDKRRKYKLFFTQVTYFFVIVLVLQVFTLLLCFFVLFCFVFFFSLLISFSFFLGGWDGVPILQVFWPEVSNTGV